MTGKKPGTTIKSPIPMLQRIQTVFLCMIAMSMGIFLFVPIWSQIEPITLRRYTLYAWHLQELAEQVSGGGRGICGVTEITIWPYVSVGILSLTIGILSAYSLYRFDNRYLQLKLGAINSLLLAALIVAIIYFYVKLPATDGFFRISCMLPIIALLANYMASKFISVDERVVQSANGAR